jgi:hypothetical protein
LKTDYARYIDKIWDSEDKAIHKQLKNRLRTIRRQIAHILSFRLPGESALKFFNHDPEVLVLLLHRFWG